MGFLRKKVVRGVEYYLWCERKREGKKKGGDGKVKSREITLGEHPYYGEWVPAYAFLGYLPIRQFLENVASWEFREYIEFWESCSFYALSDKISFQLQYHAGSESPKIVMRGRRGIDLRTKKWRRARDRVNCCLILAVDKCYLFDRKIDDIKGDIEIAKTYDSIAESAKQRTNDPYDENSRATYEISLNLANRTYSDAQKKIDSLIEKTPRKYQEEMRGKLERMIFQR